MIFDILFLPLLFFISLVISYEDVKYGKVRNRWILLGLIWGLAVISFFFIWYFIASPVSHFFYFNILKLSTGSLAPVFTVSLSYLGKCLVNFSIALIIAFLMWRFKAWAAGDAKLFMVYSLLIPLKYYWKSYLAYFPSFVLLINIFIPIFIYLLIRSIFHWFKFVHFKITKPSTSSVDREKSIYSVSPAEREKKKQAKKRARIEKIKNMLSMLLAFIGIFLIFGLFQRPIQEYFSIDISSLQMFIFAALIIFSGQLSKVFQKPLTFKIIIVVLMIILGYGFISSPQAAGQILYQSVKMMIIFIAVLTLFRKLIDFYILKTSLEEIKIEDLKPKMSLAEETLEKLKKDKEYYDRYIGVIYPGGLSLEQVEAIKKWFQKSQKHQTETVNIYKPFPFVIWMFIGLIITLLLKSSLLHLFLEN